ncbi:MAG: putative quinol monooxygenase [Deinococcales bacterium]
MHIVHVFIHIKSECIEAFKLASLENAFHSRQEAGIKSFDLLQQQDDPSQFLLIEVYHSQEDQAKHRETAHYAKWRDAVAEMMQEARYAKFYIPFHHRLGG